MNVSRHAATRLAQRAIPQRILELLLEHGERFYDHRGAIRCILGRKGRERAREELGPQFKTYALYAVLSAHDGTLITAGHRHRRIFR